MPGVTTIANFSRPSARKIRRAIGGQPRFLAPDMGGVCNRPMRHRPASRAPWVWCFEHDTFGTAVPSDAARRGDVVFEYKRLWQE